MRQRFRLTTRSAERERRSQSQDRSHSRLNLESLLHSASLAIAWVAADDQILEASHSFYNLAGYDPTELVHYTTAQLHLWDPDCPPDPTQVVKSQGQMRRKSGDWVTVDLVIEPIYSHGQLHRLVIATPTAETDLQEKAALLKEIHHRVRNNLHLISNLLDLQASTVNDEQISALFATTQNRIQAMTLIHEQLYQSADLGRIDFGEYLRRLTVNVFLVNSNDLERVTPVIRVESVWLNLETAVPCGLLINELVVNCLQHAFPDSQFGELHLELVQREQQIQIKVWDNGVGLAPNFDWQRTNSLGLKLVKILAKQLKAEITFDSSCDNSHDNSCGTAVSLSFTELKYQSRF